MLFIVTGNKQTGKTRMLQRFFDDATNNGINVCGVLSPGVWEKIEGTDIDENDYSQTHKKVGINVCLLPTNKTIPFARPAIIGDVDVGNKLAWDMYDDAIDVVNNHMKDISKYAKDKNCIIIDEIGPLELLYGKGFMSCVQLIEDGPNEMYQHVIVVIRQTLLKNAKERFVPFWGKDIYEVYPIKHDFDYMSQMILDSFVEA